MKSIVALSSLALISLSSVAPCLAVNQALGRSSDQSLPSQALPSAAKSFQVAGFFDSVNQVIRTVDKVLDANTTVDKVPDADAAQKKADLEATQRKRQAELDAARKMDNEKTRLSTQSPSPSTQNSSQSVNPLNKRSNETYEQWYGRIDPTIMYMPGAEYRAWKATLSVQDGKAYDAITRRRNTDAANQIDIMIPGIMRDAASSQDPANRPQECWRNDGRGNWNRC